MVGRLNIIEWAKKFGISSKLKPERSLSLGTQSISLIEMTNAYATIASGGIVPFIYGVKEITDRNNEVIYTRNTSNRALLDVFLVYITSLFLSVISFTP